MLRELSGSRSGRLELRPWPAPFDLDLQRETQERPDRHNAGKDPDATEGRIDGDGVDDVAGHEEFKTKQNRAAEMLPVFTVGRSRPVEAQRATNRTVAAAAPIRISKTPTSSTARVTGSFQAARSIPTTTICLHTANPACWPGDVTTVSRWRHRLSESADHGSRGTDLRCTNLLICWRASCDLFAS